MGVCALDSASGVLLEQENRRAIQERSASLGKPGPMFTTTEIGTSTPFRAHISSRARRVILCGRGNALSRKLVLPSAAICSFQGEEKYRAAPVAPKALAIVSFIGSEGPALKVESFAMVYDRKRL